MRQAAAIKRASKQARNAMYELDARGVAQLLEIYEAAAQDVRARIAAAVDANDTVPQQHLQQLLQQVEAVIDGLGQERDALVARAVDEAATLGVRPYTVQGVIAVGGSEAPLTSDAAMRVHQAAVRFVREATLADGLTLSDRLWRIDRGAKEILTRAIGQAVVQGWSAQRAVQELLYRGEPVPAALMQTLNRAKAPALASLADVLTGNRLDGGRYQAERLMRTEINRAHGEAFMAAGEGTADFAGWRYLLSPMHPRPDICDLLSTQNLHGLGEGVYPSREETPWPAHPNTLSFVEIVFGEEISDADRAGKETSLQALARLGPDQREGALGKTKAEYFDRGLMSKGMIRSPLRAVEQRLQRRGLR